MRTLYCKACQETQHRCILFETLVSTLQFSYDHLLPDRTFGQDIACLPLTSCIHTCMGVAHVHYSLVTWSRLTVSVRSPENKPQHALNAKVMYNDCSLSRSQFYNHLPGGFREKSVAA